MYANTTLEPFLYILVKGPKPVEKKTFTFYEI